jgi:Ca-activated chloride channel family protein
MEAAMTTERRRRQIPVPWAFRFVFLLWLAAHGKAQPAPELGPPVRLDQVRSGSLLLSTDRRGLYVPAPGLETDVAIRVTGIVARARVRQRFTNAAADCVEGIYVFPLPEGAAVDRMLLTIGRRVIEAEIREREEAKQVYEEAKAEGRKASLLTQERPNVFTAAVASIGAGEDVEIQIEYQEILRYEDGAFHLRFPLVVPPRYMPGNTALPGPTGTGWSPDTDRVPDASRITPPVARPGSARTNPGRLRVDLSAGIRVRRLGSVSHEIRTASLGESSYAVTLADENAVADRDFELTWEPDLTDRPVPAFFAENGGGEIYGLLVVLPPAPAQAPSARLSRETIFVIDTSGSMYGASIDQARQALLYALDRLKPEDEFNVIEFNSVMHRLFAESRRAAPETVQTARAWVGRLQAGGGTEMLPALEAALGGDRESATVRQVIFMTDGGVGNEEELFRYIREKLGRSRLFTVGIGSAPNSHFMTKAAEFGRGTFTYVGSPTEVGEKMGGLFRKLESPVLTDVRVEWDDAGAEAWPARIPDLYAGEPVVVAVRLSKPPVSAAVSGARAGEAWKECLVPGTSSGESGVDRVWARRKIGALMDVLGEPGQANQKDQVRRDVVAVALAHHLVSSFTSLVAVDRTPTLAPGTVCTPRPVPVHLPDGWDYEAVFGAMPQTATPGFLLFLASAAAFLAWFVVTIVNARKPEGRKEK